MTSIAKCRWPGGDAFQAEWIKDCPDGSMVMLALEKGPRFLKGSRIVVTPGEVVTWITPKPDPVAVRPTTPPR